MSVKYFRSVGYLDSTLMMIRSFVGMCLSFRYPDSYLSHSKTSTANVAAEMIQGAHLTRTKQLVTPLRESIIDKPPYISGTLSPPGSFFSQPSSTE